MPPVGGDIAISPPLADNATTHRLAANYDTVTPAQRAGAVGIAMLGVVGAAGAFTTIRWIGKRAHPLISVNYFATWCTLVSLVAMITFPSVGFLLLVLFGVSGNLWLRHGKRGSVSLFSRLLLARLGVGKKTN